MPKFIKRKTKKTRKTRKITGGTGDEINSSQPSMQSSSLPSLLSPSLLSDSLFVIKADLSDDDKTKINEQIIHLHEYFKNKDIIQLDEYFKNKDKNSENANVFDDVISEKILKKIYKSNKFYDKTAKDRIIFDDAHTKELVYKIYAKLFKISIETLKKKCDDLINNSKITLINLITKELNDYKDKKNIKPPEYHCRDDDSDCDD